MISSIAKHLVFQCAFASIVLAGSAPDPKAPTAIPPVPPADDPWEITASMPLWAAGIDGTVGVLGFTSETSASFADIVKKLDMAAALTLEVKKGRWGGWIDGAYLKASAGADTPGPLLNSLDIGVEQITLEAALFYRAWQSDRGFLDVYAGARYMSVGGELNFGVSNSGVQQVSQQLSQQVVDQIVSTVKTEADAALASTRSKVVSKVTTAAREKVSAVVAEKVTAVSTKVTAVSTKVTEAKTALAELQQIAASYPRLVEVLRNSSRLKSAIQSVAQARIDEKLAQAQQTAATASAVAASASAVAASASAAAASAQATVQAAADKATASAKKAVSKAEKKLAGEIENALRDAIPSQVSQTLDWVDPFVGLRAHYNFTKRFYAIAKADIGGFGVSSDLVWNAYGALGYHLTKSGDTTVELGYRHMAVDYTRGGFTFDVAMSGPMINFGMKF